MLRRAGAHPDLFVVGIDANAASMWDASRRASGPAHRGGLPNALFVVAAAESLPPEMDGFADEVSVHFPWGSLLRGVVQPDPCVLTALARVTRPGGTVSMLLSVTEHDREGSIASIDLTTIEELARRYEEHWLTLIEGRPATRDEIWAAHSSWAKRLAVGSRRPAWRLEFRRS